MYCAPLCVYADDVNVSYDFYSYEHLDSIYCPDNTDRYFKFQALWDSGSDKFAYTYGIYLYSSDYDNTTVTVSDDVTTINFPKVVSMWSCYNCYDKFGNKTGTKPGSVSLGAVTIRILKIYNSHKIEAYYSAGNLYATYTLYDINSNFDYFNTGDIYNIDVTFSPDLSGNVDRELDINGTKSMLSSLVMTVENHSIFDIQYDMRIYKKVQNSHRSYDAMVSDYTFFDDDPIFMYYKNQWVYCTNYDDLNTFLNSDTVKENKPSFWHFLSSGSTDTVTIDFSQINLLEGEEYTVTVRAIRNDYGISSEQIVYLSSSDPAIPDLFQLQGDDIHTVYTSDFVMINYSDVKYDPNNNNNGVLAYNGRDGLAARNNYQYSRNARESSDGTIDYTSRNLYTNQNSWLNQQRKDVIANHSFYSGSNSSNKFNSLVSESSSYFNLCKSVFSYLPWWVESLLIGGFIVLILIAVWHKI